MKLDEIAELSTPGNFPGGFLVIVLLKNVGRIVCQGGRTACPR
jgi:hypothetical protein